MNPEDPKLSQEIVPVAQATEARAVTKFTAAHGMEVGLPSPEAVNYMMSVAKLLLESSLITKDMGNTIEQIRANALAKMLVGHELKMQPMEALQDIDIVKGKVFVRYPQLINQLILRGFKWKWVERSNVRAAMEVVRPGMDEPELFEYTIEDAKMAGLVYADSQYVKRPRVMLSARVVSEAYRSTGGRSNVYAPEERAEVLAEIKEQRRSDPEPEENPFAPKLIPQVEKSPQGVAATSEAQAKEPTKSSNHTTTDATAGGNQTTAPAQPETATGEPAISATGPAAPPASKITQMPKPKMDARVPDLLTKVEALLPPKQKKKIVEQYFQGYFNVTDVKPVMFDPKMCDAANLLLSLASGWKIQLTGDAHTYGVAAALGWKKLNDYIAEWPEDSRLLAREMALQYADTGGEGLFDYFNVLEVDTLPHPELDAFLKVLARIGIGNSATMLKDNSTSIKEAVEGWGLDIATCQPAEIIARIGDLAPAEEEPIHTMFETGGSSEIK